MDATESTGAEPKPDGDDPPVGAPVVEVPRFAAPFLEVSETWLHYVQRSQGLIDLVHSSVGMAAGLSGIILENLDIFSNTKPESLRQLVALCDAERESGFETLHAHAVLGVWGAFECFVEDWFVAEIVSDPTLLARSEFERVKIPVSLLATQSVGAASGQILRLASQATGGEAALGVAGFERLLGFLGLSGSVAGPIRNSVFAHQQVRNVLAHRGGIVDALFVERCPGMGYSVGDRLRVSGSDLLHWTNGLMLYGVTIMNRHAHRAGKEEIAFEIPGYEGVSLAASDASLEVAPQLGTKGEP